MSLGRNILLATSALTVALITTSGAWAQDSQELETVVVSGYRASLAKAFELKRNAVGSQDSIVADDIAGYTENLPSPAAE